MNFHDFIKRALGIPSNPVLGNDDERDLFRGPYRGRDEDDEIFEEDEFSNVPSSPFGFHIFSGDPMDMHRYFEHQMNEMLKSFRSMQGDLFGQGLMELPEIGENLPDGTREPLTEESIRDKYLKPSFKESQHLPPAKTDVDLDDQIATHGLKALIPSGPGGMGHDVPQRVYGKSVITKIVRLPDGSVTQEKRVRGSDGKEEVTVTRQFGDQKHTVTTTVDGAGLEKRIEEFVNLDQNELDDFDKKWSFRSIMKPETSRDNQEPPFPMQDSTLSKIFKQFFK